MKTLWSCLCVVLSLSLANVASAQSSADVIGVEEIRPGMKGYGLTVFRGTEPERFDIEVIDVLRNFRPGQDMILIRTPHPLLDRARGVAGMSGSPIYIEGRLAGAYAYGWPQGTDPVVGVTPIANMRAELKRPVDPKSFPGAKPTHKQVASNEPVDAFSSLRSASNSLKSAAEPLGLKAATTPIMLGGMTDSVAHMLGKELEAFGFVPMQAGVGGEASANGKIKPHYEPGGAIAVQLARGDVSVNAIGTVTDVTPDGRVLAFGHPMMNAGAIGLPTATARILHILVSEFRSFKIAEAIQPYGTMVHDRQPTIVVNTDLQPARIPVRVKVNGVEGAAKTEWNVEVASHRLITPVITYSVIMNALKATVGDVADVVFRAKSTVNIDGHDPVTMEEQGFSPAGAASPMALSQLAMFGLMDAAFANPFETTRITSVDLELDLEFSREIYQIVDVSVPHDEVDPGEEITLYVRLRQVDKGDTVKAIKTRIPTAAAGKKVRLVVAAGNQVPVEQPRPNSFDDIIDQVKGRYPATSLVVALQMPTRGLRFQGHVVDSLPASALNTLQLVSTSEESRPFVTQARSEVELPQVVIGNARLGLRVRKVARDRLRGED